MNSSEGELRDTQIGKTIEGESSKFLTVAKDVAQRVPETIV